MHRFAPKLTITLLLGMCITIATAWTFVFWHPDLDERDSRPELVARMAGFPVGFGSWESDEVVGSTATTWSGLGYDSGDASRVDRTIEEPVSGIYYLYVMRCGWPFRCLSRSYDAYYRAGPNDGSEGSFDFEKTQWTWHVFGESLDSQQAGQRSLLLPLYPIWPGFVINTLFYAAILWLVAFAPLKFRRYLRHKRGQCIQCGYDLRRDVSAGCPECGWRRKEKDAQQPA